ncbi:MAG TPA: hypothetical protein VG389_25145, partial [Myxococcota bacterium]|nr:hypothetical protein [Myxococcota bacterium]
MQRQATLGETSKARPAGAWSHRRAARLGLAGSAIGLVLAFCGGVAPAAPPAAKRVVSGAGTGPTTGADAAAAAAAAGVESKSAKGAATADSAATPGTAYGVCLEMRSPADAARVVARLAARHLPVGAGWHFVARPSAASDASAADAPPQPCYGAFGRVVDAWASALALRADPALAAEGLSVVGHRVVDLSPLRAAPAAASLASASTITPVALKPGALKVGAAKSGAAKAGAAMRPDALTLPGSGAAPGDAAGGPAPDLGRLPDVTVPAGPDLLEALRRAGSGPWSSGGPASVGVVATGGADVFATPDAWLPPSAMALARLERFAQVVVTGGEFRCDAGAACLYWSRVLYGPTWRAGWVPAGHVVPVSHGVRSPDGSRIAYLTARARIPFTPAPFYSAKAAPTSALTDVYDLWMYDADAGAFGRVETFSLAAGTRVSTLRWGSGSGDAGLAVMGADKDTPVFRTTAHIGPAKKFTKKKRAKKKPAP